MTLGALIYVAQDEDEAALRVFLGAPVVVRSLAPLLSVPHEVVAVAAVPPGVEPVLRAEADRFGLSELQAVVGPEPAADLPAAVAAALEAVGDVSLLVVHHGLGALLPPQQVRALLEAAGPNGLAVCGTQVQGAFMAGPELGEAVDGPLWVPQLPMAGTPENWRRLLEAEGETLWGRAVAAGLAVACVPADPDALWVSSEAALGRALEVFGRRAPDLAFIWPRTGGNTSAAVSMPPVTPAPNLTVVDADG